MSIKNIRMHGMKDERWTVRDKIQQYRGILKLYGKLTIFFFSSKYLTENFIRCRKVYLSIWPHKKEVKTEINDFYIFFIFGSQIEKRNYKSLTRQEWRRKFRKIWKLSRKTCKIIEKLARMWQKVTNAVCEQFSSITETTNWLFKTWDPMYEPIFLLHCLKSYLLTQQSDIAIAVSIEKIRAAYCTKLWYRIFRYLNSYRGNTLPKIYFFVLFVTNLYFSYHKNSLITFIGSVWLYLSPQWREP